MPQTVKIKKTSLYNHHLELQAKMVPFAGYLMPISYSKIHDEYYAVRNKCGIFDVSHMGMIQIKGHDASNLIQTLTVNDIQKIKANEAQYTAMCNQNGGLIDDLIVLKLSSSDYILIVNASNKIKVLNWINKNKNSHEFIIHNMNEDNSLLALQGPTSRAVLEKISDNNFQNFPFYKFRKITLLGEEVILSRTGYTGELGYEIIANHNHIKLLWDCFMKNQVIPTGLAVRDILRLEMKYCLYGNDINENINPLEAGLSWIVDFDKGPFIGRDVLIAKKKKGAEIFLCSFSMLDKGIPRHGYTIICNGEEVGEVTSGSYSISLGRGIGLGYIEKTFYKINQILYIKIRGELKKAEIISPPFIKNTSLYH